jgi:hypothetical protein
MFIIIIIIIIIIHKRRTSTAGTAFKPSCLRFLPALGLPGAVAWLRPKANETAFFFSSEVLILKSSALHKS